jgi:hypothetical protein
MNVLNVAPAVPRPIVQRGELLLTKAIEAVSDPAQTAISIYGYRPATTPHQAVPGCGALRYTHQLRWPVGSWSDGAPTWRRPRGA